jgi:hypothetical protein
VLDDIAWIATMTSLRRYCCGAWAFLAVLGLPGLSVSGLEGALGAPTPQLYSVLSHGEPAAKELN